jgi:hypothetical protein
MTRVAEKLRFAAAVQPLQRDIPEQEVDVTANLYSTSP